MNSLKQLDAVLEKITERGLYISESDSTSARKYIRNWGFTWFLTDADHPLYFRNHSSVWDGYRKIPTITVDEFLKGAGVGTEDLIEIL